MRNGLLPLLLAALLLAGCSSPASGPAPSAEGGAAAAQPSVVIAVIDTGINLYHSEYRRSDPLPVPAGVPDRAPVQLTLGAESYAAAEKADHDALMKLKPKTLYTFPGTKVLAAISFEDPGQTVPSDWPLILDQPKTYAHGTMTTSRATGNTVSIPGNDTGVWLVLVQGFTPEAVQWAAEQPWIDLISISAGLSPYSIAPLVPNALDTTAIPAYNAASHAKPFFASSGNGMGNAGVLGFPAAMRGSSGVPDAVSVGANDNDQISHWHNQGPYVSADGCNNPRADPADLGKILMDGGGTSSATPFSAGGGAKMLLEARRILGDTAVGPRAAPGPSAPAAPGAWSSGRPEDAQVVLAQGPAGLAAEGPLADGVFTLAEFKDVLYHTALVTPTDDASDGVRCDAQNNAEGSGTWAGGTYVPASSVPADERFPFDGYGEVNHQSIAAAVEVLLGHAGVPARPADDASYAQARDAKMALVGDAED
jgi:hypothetical protein